MATIKSNKIPAERIVSIGDFVERVYLPWIEEHKRPSTAKGYRDIWLGHLKPLCGQVWLRDVRTYYVQGWLNEIGAGKLSRNTLKHVKSVISAIFSLAKQQDYFQGENPARDTAVNPAATEPQETYAYSLDEIHAILSLLPEPGATAFAIAAFMGLRHGEIQGLLWENYREGEMYVSRSIWNGQVTAPKTRKSQAPIPVIKPLAERLLIHKLRCGNPETGPIFANGAGKPLSLTSLLNRAIIPALNRCGHCGKSEAEHGNESHQYKRNDRIPEWHGWHAARRGLGSNLYRLGVPDIVIQRILRHANVSTTATYYIKTAADDVRNAMAKLENHITASAQSRVGAVSKQQPTAPPAIQ
jgi:integrase